MPPAEISTYYKARLNRIISVLKNMVELLAIKLYSIKDCVPLKYSRFIILKGYIMSDKWIITSKIHISESDFRLWLNSSAEFISTMELFNCDVDDKMVNGILRGSLKTPHKSTIAIFFANLLADMTLSFERETLLIYYSKRDSSLNITAEINREGAFNAASYNLAVILSIIKFKNNDIKDVCIISNENFDNVKYAAEFDASSVKLIKCLSGDDIVIPERYGLIYKMQDDPDYINRYLDKNIFNIFSEIIKKRLETDKEDIILFSSPAHPAVITHDAMYKTDGKNVLTGDGNIVEGANPVSFMSLGLGYATDGSSLYYGTKKMNGADLSSFFVLKWGYAKDKTHAFFNGEPICKITCNFRALRLAKGYATNNIVVFYNGRPLQGSDPIAFKAIGDEDYEKCEFIAADNMFAYHNGEIVNHIDFNSIVSIGKNFFKDDNNVYRVTRILEGLSPKNTRVLNEYYIADKTNAVYADKNTTVTLQDVNPLGLRAKGKLATDNVNVYYKGVKIEGLNGAETDLDRDNFCGYLSDKNSVYYYMDKIDADPSTFKALDFGYGTDGKRLFFKTSVIKEGEFQSVISLFDSMAETSDEMTDEDKTDFGGAFQKIKNSVYYAQTHIKEADGATFKPFSVNILGADIITGYAADKSNVFYKDKKIDGADRETFKILANPGESSYLYIPETACDKNRAYHKGEILDGVDTRGIKPFVISRAWMLENGDILYRGKIAKGIDIDNFRNIDGNIYGDEKRVYYKVMPIENIDISQLLIISDNYIKDDDHFCYLEEDTDGNLTINVFKPHINSFDISGDNSLFSFDRYNIYFKGKAVENADMESLEIIGDNYLRDKNGIFCGNIKLDNADANNFMLLGEGYATDIKQTYYQATILNTIAMLHVLGEGYATDGTNFYIKGEKIENPYEHQFIMDILGQGFM